MKYQETTSLENVKRIIAASQDERMLNEKNRFDQILLALISHCTDTDLSNNEFVDVEPLKANLDYAINQLEKAKQALNDNF